jgi:septation ring formation regulator EzrA
VAELEDFLESSESEIKNIKNINSRLKTSLTEANSQIRALRKEVSLLKESNDLMQGELQAQREFELEAHSYKQCFEDLDDVINKFITSEVDRKSTVQETLNAIFAAKSSEIDGIRKVSLIFQKNLWLHFIIWLDSGRL